jgi:hypothetical protein
MTPFRPTIKESRAEMRCLVIWILLLNAPDLMPREPEPLFREHTPIGGIPWPASHRFYLTFARPASGLLPAPEHVLHSGAGRHGLRSQAGAPGRPSDVEGVR